MSRLVQTWRVQNGRLVKLQTPPRVPKTQTVSKTGSVRVNVFTGGTTVLPISYPGTPGNPVAEYPIVKWEQLDTTYSQRNLNSWAELPVVATYLNKLTTPSYVEMPEGFRGKTVNFNPSWNYISCLAKNCMGLWGKGAEKAIIRLEPYSSTIAGLITPQPVTGAANGDAQGGPADGATVMRLGPTNDHTFVAVRNYGFALFGTDQPDQPAGAKPGTYAHPHNFSGMVQYMGTGSRDQCLVIGGMQADWNSPPGEKFTYSMFRNPSQCFVEFCEFTGFQEAGIAQGAPPTDYLGATGRRVGGGVGNNGGTNPTYTDCYVHDSLVSGGPIFSGAGGPLGDLTVGCTVKNTRTWDNANWSYPDPGGQSFGGINNEGMLGNVYHENSDIRLGPNQNNIQKEHFFFGNWVGNPDSIVIKGATWEGPHNTSDPRRWIAGSGGLLYINQPEVYATKPNTCTRPPQVYNKRGELMTPIIRAPGAGWVGRPAGSTYETHYWLRK